MSYDKQFAATIDALLREAVAQAAKGPAVPQDVTDSKQGAAQQIADIFKSAPPEVQAGGPKTVIFGTSVNFGGTVWPLLSCGVTLLLAPLDPTGLTWGAAGAAIMNAIDKLRNVITKLDPAQRVLCRAILEVAREKQAKNNEPEASEEDIKAYFKKQQELVPKDLDKLLAGLVKDKILSAQHYPEAGTYYRVAF